MFKDLSGKIFGRLEVIERAETKIEDNGKHRAMWRCKCKCGNEIVVRSDHLSMGRISSCGCLKKEIVSDKQKVHGESKTKLYGVWCAMKRRCYNKNTKFYGDYGRRGILVCDEWKDDYEAFRKWMLDNGYHDGLTIDRIDNNRGYSPDNCRIVTMKEQGNNRRSNVLYTSNGETHNLKQWSEITGINYKTLHNRIRTGWKFEDAIKK